MAKISIPKITTLAIIIFTTAIVTFFVVFTILSLKPEGSIKRQIEAIAADYYENYFYPKLTSSGTKNLNRYTSSGFARVSLRQLLLFDNERYKKSAPLITKYCNENKTFVQFFPEPPFNKNNYHAEYHYSCEF